MNKKKLKIFYIGKEILKIFLRRKKNFKNSLRRKKNSKKYVHPPPTRNPQYSLNKLR